MRPEKLCDLYSNLINGLQITLQVEYRKKSLFKDPIKLNNGPLKEHAISK